MAMNIGELFAILRLDAGAFHSGMGMAIELSQKFIQVAGKIGVASIKAASDFNETSNVIQQAFGKSSDAVEKWAADTGDAMGRSTQQIRQFSGVMQAMLSPMLGSSDAAEQVSKSITKLAVDMGSFWNVADEDAFAALRSGLSGEAEPLKRFGIVMNDAALNAYALAEGIKISYTNMDEASRVQLRYNFILDRTTMVQGDAERTSDGWANQTKALDADLANAAATIGQDLIPVAQEWMEVLRELIGMGGESGPLTKAFTTFFGALSHGFIETGKKIGLLASTMWTFVTEGPRAAFEAAMAFQDDLAAAERASLVAPRTGEVGNPWRPDEAQQRRVHNIINEPTYSAKAKEDKTRKESGGFDSLELSPILSSYIKDAIESNKEFDKNLKEASDALTKLTKETDKETEARKKGAKEVSRAGAGLMKAALSGDLGGLFVGAEQGVSGLDKTGTKIPGVGNVEGAGAGLGFAATMIVDAGKQFLGMVKAAADVFILPFMNALPGSAKGAMGAMAPVGALASLGPTSLATIIPSILLFNTGLPIVVGGLFALGAGLTMAYAGILSLSTQSKQYAAFQGYLTKAMEPLVLASGQLWAGLSPLAGIAFFAATGLASFINILLPGAQVYEFLFNATKNLTVAFLTIEVGLLEFAKNLPGMDRKYMGEQKGNAESALRAVSELEYGTALASAGMLDVAKSAAALNASMTNLPAGFKLAAYAFSATTGEAGNPYQSPGQGGPGRRDGVTIQNATFMVQNYQDFLDQMDLDGMARVGKRKGRSIAGYATRG